MSKSALALVAAALIWFAGIGLAQSLSASPTRVTAPPVAENRNHVNGRTAWDDEFFYIALQVNKPVLQGTNHDPFSNPLDDDAAIISIQTDDDRKSTGRTRATVTVAVSEAGGVQLYRGDKATPLATSVKEFTERLAAIEKNEKDPVVQQRLRLELLATIPKVQVIQHGAPRAGAAPSTGYTLEIAIPWVDLGGKPNTDSKMGFNVAVQSKAPGSPLLQSLSPAVKGASDLENPSLWTEITFSTAAKPGGATGLICARVFANKPAIDGEIGDGEWNGLSAFGFGEQIEENGGGGALASTIAARTRADYAPQPPRPLAAYRTQPVGPLPEHRSQPIPQLIFTRYEYWFQGNARKAAPAQHVFKADHSTAMAHHPLDGAGPWLSYDSVDWHRRQLTEMRRDGIDVVLPCFRGSPRDRALYADKGLTVLASALQYMRAAGLDYPQVGLYLDTDSLIETLGDRPDLHSDAAKSALYGMIRDFYRRIPAEFRCVVQLNSENGGRRGYPVFLSSADAFRDMDPTATAYLRSRFAADFDDADLILVGGQGFGSQLPLDGLFYSPQSPPAGKNGWIAAALVSTGYAVDEAAEVSDGAHDLRPRKLGATYRADWAQAIKTRYDWVLLDSWNDFSLGGEIAPSLEDGYTIADITRFSAQLFTGAVKAKAKAVWNDAPPSMPAGVSTTVHGRFVNAGTMPWGHDGPADVGIGFSYRWKRGAEVVATGVAQEPGAVILPGQSADIALRVRAAGANGPLAPGAYTLEIGAVNVGKRPPSALIVDEANSGRISIPVNVGPSVPEYAATLVSNTLPPMLENGSVYSVSASIRNDGSTTWSKGDDTRVTLRLYRTAVDGVPTPVPTSDASAPLDRDVAPGEIADVRLLLAMTDPEGKPIPSWTPDMNWNYALQWEIGSSRVRAAQAALTNGDGGTPTGVAIAPTPIALVDFDFGVRFTADATPPSLPGERRQPVPLSIKNVGPQTWKKSSVRVGYHWYYQDGTEFLWEDETTGIPADVAPGESVSNLLAWVTAPPCDGTYYLVWDVKFGDTWASTSAGSRVFDQMVHPVQVVGGHLTFIDLAKAYDLDGVSEPEAPSEGDFDGHGRSFPAGLVPPFTDASIVPATMWQPYDQSGPESPRRISFRWGPKTGKQDNFVVCRGQRIELGKANPSCRLLHILAASTGKSIVTNIRLIFQEPTSQSEDLYALSVSPWDSQPVYREETAFLAHRHHEKSGIQPGSVALYHYVIRIREPRNLVALKLPDAPDIKIAAITLEK